MRVWIFIFNVLFSICVIFSLNGEGFWVEEEEGVLWSVSFFNDKSFWEAGKFVLSIYSKFFVILKIYIVF